MELRPVTKIRTAEQGVELALENFCQVVKNDPGRVQSLRVSSFPFCPAKWWLSLPNRLLGSREETFQSSYFTGVGTQVHTQFQAALDSSPFVIRDWECAGCKHLHEFVTRPKKCGGCGSSTTYLRPKEHEVRLSCIVGHIDDSFLLHDGTIEILDYKTTSDAAVARKPTSTGALPHLSNVRQIESYAAIKKHQGQPISGWALAYISRNAGARKYVTAKQFYGHSFDDEYPRILKRLKTYIRDFKDIAGVVNLDDLPGVLSRRRLTPTKADKSGLCDYCAFQPMCKNEKLMATHSQKVFKIMESRLPVYPPKSLKSSG